MIADEKITQDKKKNRPHVRDWQKVQTAEGWRRAHVVVPKKKKSK